MSSTAATLARFMFMLIIVVELNFIYDTTYNVVLNFVFNSSRAEGFLNGEINGALELLFLGSFTDLRGGDDSKRRRGSKACLELLALVL